SISNTCTKSFTKFSKFGRADGEPFPPSYTTLFGVFTFLWPQPKNQCHYIRTYSCSFWIKLLIIFELFFQVSRLCTIEPREFCCYIIGRTFHSFLSDELNEIKNFLQS